MDINTAFCFLWSTCHAQPRSAAFSLQRIVRHITAFGSFFIALAYVPYIVYNHCTAHLNQNLSRNRQSSQSAYLR